MSASEIERFSVNWFDEYDHHIVVIVDGQYIPAGIDSMAGPADEAWFEVESAMTMDLRRYDLDDEDCREAFEMAACQQWENHLDRIDALNEERCEGGPGYVICPDGSRDYDTGKYLKRASAKRSR